MNSRRRGRGSPLWLRLSALVVVPVVAVTVLGVQRVETEQRAADAASRLVDDVEHRSAVAAVIVAAEVERTALVGLARLDEIGLPRELVTGVTNVDFESVYEQNLDALDRALGLVIEQHGRDVLIDGTQLGTRLTAVEGRLAAQRELSRLGRAPVDDIDRTYAELDDILEVALVSDSHGSERSVALDRQRSQIDALGAVVLSAGDLTRVLIDELVQESPDRVQLARAEAAHQAFVEAFRTTLDSDERTRLRRVEAARAPSTDDLRLGEEPDDLFMNPNQFRLAADNLLGQLDYIDQLGAYASGFMERTAFAARSQAAVATDEATRTQVLIWTLAVLTLALVGLVLWSTLAPIRRLTRRADAVSAGRLASEPLPVGGPRDIRRLTATMNEMEVALGRVHDRITRLAAGDVDDPDDDPIPGAIGVALRNSVRHLATVTSQLHRSEALSTAIIDQADDAIWTIDEAGTILTANAASVRLTGRTIDEQAGRTIDEFLSTSDGEAVVLTHDGPAMTVLVASSVIDAGDDRVVAVIAHDISERSRFEEQLAYQAMHDELTGLPNRFALLEHVERLRREHPGGVAVLYLDLDGFKSVNDLQGHAVGDRVLAEVAGKLAATVRDDDFVGRLGGDEFVVVTHRFSETDEVLALANRLVREVELPHEDGGQFFSLSASVGVAVPPRDTEALVMISQADSAVYQAKRQGRGRVVLFDREMQQQLDAATELELALRSAVANDELVMHLQPVFDLGNGEIRGGEALVRWMRPGHGLVPPNEFIPVAERSEVIVGIQTWVLRQACERVVAWREREPGCTHRIAVNVSGRHLAEGDLVGDVSGILHETGADPSMLELELTETHLLEDVARATSTLDRLRSMGITIAVDDFGTGYSSMTYLRDLPVDVLKIDRTFVARATEHGYDSTVVEAVLAIARILDLRVVAEGVETAEQLDFVRTRGCDAAQGFLMARPMPVDDAESVIFGSHDIGAGEEREDAALRGASRPTRSRPA